VMWNLLKWISSGTLPEPTHDIGRRKEGPGFGISSN